MKCRGFRGVSMQADRLRNPNRSHENRARAASRPAAPSPIRQSRSHAHVSFRSSHHRRFQEFECAFPICIQTRLYAQRYRKHGPHGMPDGSTEYDRDTERPQNSRADFPYSGSTSHDRLTFRKVSQHNPAHAFELTGLFQMHQDAIHLVGLHGAIFENKDRILGVQFPRRSNRGLQQSHASAQNSAHGLTREDGFTLQPQLPAAFRFAYRLKKRAFIIALARTRTRVEPGGNHWTVESDPVTLLPQKDLQSGEIAESNHALEIGDAFLQFEFQKIIRSVTAAQGDKSIDLAGIQGPKKTIGPLQGRTGKVPLSFGGLTRNDLKALPLQFRKSGDRFDGLRGR